VTESFADERNLHPGQRLRFESYTPEQLDAFLGGGEAVDPAGPVVELTVTGVVRYPDGLSEDVTSFEPSVLLPQGFYQEYRDRIGSYEGSTSVRLRSGTDDFPAFAEAVRRIFPDDPELEVEPQSEATERTTDSVNVLVVALLLFAGCAGLAGLVAVGQALARHLSQTVVDQPTLASLGMSRRQRVSALMAFAAPVVACGSLAGLLLAVAASPLMPVGVARRAEPDPGVSFDGLVLPVGAIGTVVAVGALAFLGAWRATRSPAEADSRVVRSMWRSAVSRSVARTGLPPTATTGARMALDPGTGSAAVPVRSALTGTAFGVAGVAAAIVFATSLSGLIDTPARYGFKWDALMASFGGGDLVGQFGAELLADPAVRDLGAVTHEQGELAGQEVPLYGFTVLKGSAAPSLLDGRMATKPHEVVLGSRTAEDLGLSVGDTLDAQGDEGSVTLTVVGRGAFPILSDRSTVGRGAGLTGEGLDRLGVHDDERSTDLLLSWAPAVDVPAANTDLEQRTGAQVFATRVPADVTNLQQVEVLPRALSAFLALLVLLAAGHVMTTTVRRRRRDLAVLRALGFVRLQVSATITWQGTTLVLVGLAAGIPLGIIAGRSAWSLVADGIGVQDRTTIPLLALGLVVLLALLVVNLVASFPALVAGRIRPAAVLRTE
jgi:hypothetical protein